MERPVRRDSSSGEDRQPLAGSGSIRTCSAQGQCSTWRITVGTHGAGDRYRSYRANTGEVQLVFDEAEGVGFPSVLVASTLQSRNRTLNGTYNLIISNGERIPPTVRGAMRLVRLF